jgi:hypothetical protein
VTEAFPAAARVVDAPELIDPEDPPVTTDADSSYCSASRTGVLVLASAVWGFVALVLAGVVGAHWLREVAAVLLGTAAGLLVIALILVGKGVLTARGAR